MLGDFNALVNHALDSDGVTPPNTWPWLNNSLSFTHHSPQLLDSFRVRHPHQRELTRFPSILHANQTRIDLILLPPLLNSRFPVLSASIDSSNKFSDHHPVSTIISTPSLANNNTTNKANLCLPQIKKGRDTALLQFDLRP